MAQKKLGFDTSGTFDTVFVQLYLCVFRAPNLGRIVLIQIFIRIQKEVSKVSKASEGLEIISLELALSWRYWHYSFIANFLSV